MIYGGSQHHFEQHLDLDAERNIMWSPYRSHGAETW
jgi:hypothetical protein